jgi:hypothetical protein
LSKRSKIKKHIIGRKPLDGYKDIQRMEEKELKKLTIKEAVKQTEELLKMAELWMRCSKSLSLPSKNSR